MRRFSKMTAGQKCNVLWALELDQDPTNKRQFLFFEVSSLFFYSSPRFCYLEYTGSPRLSSFSRGERVKVANWEICAFLRGNFLSPEDLDRVEDISYLGKDKYGSLSNVRKVFSELTAFST